MPNHYIIMGVSGCGKSTVGAMLAEKLAIPFFDGDDFHPPANIDKMASGTPLDDHDRKPWLEKLASLPITYPKGCVTACSALKKKYRKHLVSNKEQAIIYLRGSKKTLLGRITDREDHFMPSSLLDSQLQTLEYPTDESNCIAIDIDQSPTQILTQILNAISDEHC